MKITKIETHKHWVDWCNWMFVRIETDEGLVGWGEASLHGALDSVESAIREFAPHLIGQDPAGPERHWHRLYNAWRWRAGAVFSTALAGIDLALWDLEGKRLGVPVHRLLGGAHRNSLRVYASHWLNAKMTPDEAHAGAKEAVRRGFTGFKFSPLTHEALKADESGAIRRATEVMAAAREGAGPDVDIFIECSESLSPRTAVMLDRAFAPYRPGWFEEPVPFENAAVMVRLQREISTPIATGERLLSRYEYRELIEGGGVKIIQPDLMHAGGITEVRRIASFADTYYIPVAPHNPGGPICTVASMHLAAAIPNFYILEQMEPQREFRDRSAAPAVKFEKGHFILPQGPGWGIEPDLEIMKSKPYQPQSRVERGGALWS
ncbi:MAG: mandelate racemase/muconate lactonizing enzyme family protein [Alphaproteobacteria bacterium]|nr:mandelate racemase/muconate lactonizing enzyme family protein [Alphaproteobacteria bacterium]